MQTPWGAAESRPNCGRALAARSRQTQAINPNQAYYSNPPRAGKDISLYATWRHGRAALVMALADARHPGPDGAVTVTDQKACCRFEIRAGPGKHKLRVNGWSCNSWGGREWRAAWSASGALEAQNPQSQPDGCIKALLSCGGPELVHPRQSWFKVTEERMVCKGCWVFHCCQRL